MSETIGSRDHIYALSDRITYLEEVNHRVVSLLNMLASCGDFYAGINRDREQTTIFGASRLQLKRLMPFEAMAFFSVNEADLSFVLADCEPPSSQRAVQQEVDAKIMDGTFAWALNQNRPVIVPANSAEYSLILHVLSTQCRIRGMFVGSVRNDRLEVSDPYLNALSITLLNVAYALENAGLYRQINDHRENLEREVQRRTVELEKSRQQADEANMAKSQFLANISHEIRTPMNGVIGFTEMLMGTCLTEEQKGYAQLIKRSGEGLLGLINEVLDFSKIEAGKCDLESVEFDPEQIAHEVCELLHPKIQDRAIELLCRVGEKVPSSVNGDPTRFRQVLINLMANAEKFTDSGEIELSLDVETEERAQLQLHVTVRDTGIGIDKGKTAIIFEPFRQADGSTTRKYGGTGLGLPISRHLARCMGGNVWVESDCRGGSTFHFTARFNKTLSGAERWCEGASLQGRRVLIVDDRERSLDILTEMLQVNGARVERLSTGDLALSTLCEAFNGNDPFDLCLLDIDMPHLNGYEVAWQIQDTRTLVKKPFLFALSKPGRHHAQKLLGGGFCGILVKPVCRRKLLDSIERLFGHETSKGTVRSGEVKTVQVLRDRISEERRVRILIAEDNPVNQKLAMMMLQKTGYDVVIAGNGREVVDMYIDAPDAYDLLFMDVQMPEMDGYEATRRIRSGGFSAVPIIAMTAHALREDREKCIESGMNDYLSKPFRKEAVLEVVNKWVRVPQRA